MPPPATAIEGTCDPKFAGVREAFAKNFDKGDLGAACAVTIEGELVVDLWGGHRDIARQLPWQRNTLVNVWSTTKMLSALCVLMLHDRGALSVDAPLAEYWPEFAANGKAGVLVRHVLSHTAGLPRFDEPVDDLEVFDWDACCARLAAQAPRWTPGEDLGYHAETQGWLLGELVRRVEGRTLGTFLREEVTSPLGLDVHIGLDEREHGRVADVATMHAPPIVPPERKLTAKQRGLALRSASLVNTIAWRRAEFAAANAHGNARSVALALAALANGGQHGGKQLLSPATIERTFEVQADRRCRSTGAHFRLGIGYGLNSPSTPLGANDRTLFWGGWGGSLSVVDLENRMTVSYTMNRMLTGRDVRAARVIFATHSAIA